MRFPAVLFAFYLLLLSCLPCADDVARVPAPEGSSIALGQHLAADQQHNDEQADWCSPLCQCQCCPGAVLLPLRAVACGLASAPPWGARTYGLAAPHTLLLRPLAAPWQPPQLA